jgi:EAL domain-containing protein (putative c-di-GMP-specific phosphodiesterase class I)/DNA-binding response OmpR family regulator
VNGDVHILVVDDDENNRFMLSQRLRQLGFQWITEVANGEAALAHVRRAPVDLVLLDVMMPGIDGISVLQALRQEGRLSELPVLMVSAHDSLEIAARCIELGAEDYLTKPIQVPMLRARVAAILEKRRLRAVERSFLTHFDPDTHLPNRHALLERVDGLLACGRRFALVAVTRRDHGSIALGVGENDASQYLRALSDRMLGSELHTDIVARVGDDTLAWLLPDVQPDHLLLRDVEWVLDLAPQSHAFSVGRMRDCVVGIAIGSPADRHENAAELLRLAMSEASRIAADASERVQIADPALRTATRDALAMHQEVERALARGELVLYLQPIVDVRDRRLMGAEALLRWQHPERGLLPPAAFLGAVERSPLMEAIDAWVVDHATTLLGAWADRLPVGFRLHVNVTARGLASGRVAELIERRISPQARDHLAVELTERLHVPDMPACVTALKELRALGVHVALDDFGTGFSSLSHINLMPCDTLKIDRSFVADVATDGKRRMLLQSLVGMAQSLGLSVVAEGVECESELEVLRQIGGMQLQGYLLGRPMPELELYAQME